MSRSIGVGRGGFGDETLDEKVRMMMYEHQHRQPSIGRFEGRQLIICNNQKATT